MQERHNDRKLYFNEQASTSEKYVIPFIADKIEINENTSVLEIGCGEGGNLVPFLDRGCKEVVGIDLSEEKIKNAIAYFSDHKNKQNATFIAEDIYTTQKLGQYDVIIMRDVLEHIHDQERFMDYVKKFLKPDGKFYLGFPPWQNPFGGHQQMCYSKFLSKLPFFHILPAPIYRAILKAFGEPEGRINSLLEIHETQITIERFQRIIKRSGYRIDKRIFYFINPNYEIKFGLKPREQSKLLTWIPYFRNYLITTNYYLISVKE